MADIDTLLNRWQSAGVLSAEAASRIRAWEHQQKRPAGLRWQGLVALILGAILLACGVVLFVNAHWDGIGPGGRFALVLAMVSLFHLAGGLVREKFHGLSTALHAVGTASTGAAIALTGQIFNIQEHWPAAILMWAIAALIGWALLHDEAQETLALLLIPAWMISEFTYYAENHIGQGAYIGRFLFVWAVLYLTFLLGSRRKAVQGILFAAGAIAAVLGVVMMVEGWRSWGSMTSLPWGLSVWGWTAIAALPLIVALVRFTRSFVPVVAAVAFTIALPWCNRIWTEHYNNVGGHSSYTRNEPNLLAYALVAAFAVFLVAWGFMRASKALIALGAVYFALTAIWFANSEIWTEIARQFLGQLMCAGAAIFVIWWGVRLSSKALVNLGMVGFAITVGWFYFSEIFDKVGRSLGLIGLGVLFLAGGWLLEKTRRRLIGTMGAGTMAAPAADGSAPAQEVAP
jgi:uncharacterized membrane protein